MEQINNGGAYNADGSREQTDADESAQVLAHLEHQAGAFDTENAPQFAPQVGQGGELVQFDPAAECETLLTMAREVLSPLYPSLQVVYTEATIKRISQAAAPVMVKYNFSSGGLLGKFGPEITLAAVVVPVAMETIKAVRFDHAQRLAANDAVNEAVANGPQQ